MVGRYLNHHINGIVEFEDLIIIHIRQRRLLSTTFNCKICLEDYICRNDFCHLHLSISTNSVFHRRKLLLSNQKMGDWSPMKRSICNAYTRVQSFLHSEIYPTFENNHESTCKLSVCRLPISFVQLTSTFVQVKLFVKQLLRHR